MQGAQAAQNAQTQKAQDPNSDDKDKDDAEKLDKDTDGKDADGKDADKTEDEATKDGQPDTQSAGAQAGPATPGERPPIHFEFDMDREQVPGPVNVTLDPDHPNAAPVEAPAEIKPETGLEAGFERSAGIEGGIVGGVAGGITGGIPEPPPPPPPPPAAPVRVGGNIKAPQKVKHVNPVYPPIAQSARVQGVVIIEATIGPDGAVKDAKVLRSIPLLDQAALDAVRQWQFTPTLVNGVPVPVIMTVTVQFTLQ